VRERGDAVRGGENRKVGVTRQATGRHRPYKAIARAPLSLSPYRERL
jgi:hypothetical protein